MLRLRKVRLHKGLKKVWVQVLELNGETPFRKYPVDESGCVIISAGGRGPKDLKEHPELKPEAWRERGWLFKRRYLIYPRYSNRFLIRGESIEPPISLELIRQLIDVSAMEAYRGKEKTPILTYIMLAVQVFTVILILGG